MMETLVQFGVAGLMGVLWVWERTHGRRREVELSEAHRRLMDQDVELAVLIGLVRRNTAAMVGLERSQGRMIDLLEEVRREMRGENKAA